FQKELVVCSMNDVTEEMQQEENRQLHKEIEAKAISRLLHDLKTPMNVAASVADDVISSFQTHQIECPELSRNVDLLRTVCRIASNRASAYSIHKEAVMQYTYTSCLATAVGDSIDLYKPLFSKLEDLQFVKETDIPVNIASLIPEDAIRRNLENLISNAIKYTHKGYIKVAYSLLDNMLQIQVEDTGKGVPPSKKEDVFKGTQLQYTSEGIGVGLQSVMLLSDSVRCYDNPRVQGSVFEFTMVVTLTGNDDPGTPTGMSVSEVECTETGSNESRDMAAPPSHPPCIADGIDNTLSILLVEDDKIQLAILKKKVMHAFPHCKLLTACNGLEGLELIRHHDCDIILSDFNMPVMDGASMFKKAYSEMDMSSTWCGLISAGIQSQIPSVPGVHIQDKACLKLEHILEMMPSQKR
ncbi:hypothetical protein CYMTET_20209, partial [Cymbomonas tetramitiformis]